MRRTAADSAGGAAVTHPRRAALTTSTSTRRFPTSGSGGRSRPGPRRDDDPRLGHLALALPRAPNNDNNGGDTGPTLRALRGDRCPGDLLYVAAIKAAFAALSEELRSENQTASSSSLVVPPAARASLGRPPGCSGRRSRAC
jgi:hypothetical protein